ncbi:hypothetical protein TELCIR_12303 [Teladorsagia circumcincta]|uniref:CUB domain-containing protein n=1 Tax=Teladorsagia circumcincta TaxID=45464 RepID=A0A2G9U6U2_TELCI|nr:hypothetical protein TELCIR_12303 [Teladorsagia circumcincta]
MGGFPHPRDCTKCICPTGYGGVLCNERPSGCGRTVLASSNWTDLVDILYRKWNDPNEYTMCNYWIESPNGTTIEVKLRYYPWDYSDYGCKYAGFEIKTNKDQTCTGYR